MIDKIHTPKASDRGKSILKSLKFNSFKELTNLSNITNSSSKDIYQKEQPNLEAEFSVIDYMKPHIKSLHELDFNKIQEELAHRTIYLTAPPTRPVLILDLDETMIFNGLRDDDKPYDYIVIRPYADEFLEQVSSMYEIWVWTASDIDYATYALAMLDPHNKYVKCVLTQDFCTPVGATWVKDIRIFSNLNLAKVIIIDNLLVSFAATLNNGILISPFLNKGVDSELEMLGPFLISISGCSDFRDIIKTTFDYTQYSY